MPLYDYKCNKCGFQFDVHVMIKFRNDAQVCPSCNGPASRDVEAELQHFGEHEKGAHDHPRWSWSMGATPEVAQEMLKKYPDFEYKYGKFGGPLLVKNRSDKLRKMKIHNFQEY